MSNLGNKPGAQSGATIQRQTHRTEVKPAMTTTTAVVAGPQQVKLLKPVKQAKKSKRRKGK